MMGPREGVWRKLYQGNEGYMSMEYNTDKFEEMLC